MILHTRNLPRDRPHSLLPFQKRSIVGSGVLSRQIFLWAKPMFHPLNLYGETVYRPVLPPTLGIPFLQYYFPVAVLLKSIRQFGYENAISMIENLSHCMYFSFVWPKFVWQRDTLQFLQRNLNVN